MQVSTEGEMRALLCTLQRGEHAAYNPRGDGAMFSLLDPDWLGENSGRPTPQVEALLPSSPEELFDQQRALQEFYAGWVEEDQAEAQVLPAAGEGGQGEQGVAAEEEGEEVCLPPPQPLSLASQASAQSPCDQSLTVSLPPPQPLSLASQASAQSPCDQSLTVSLPPRSVPPSQVSPTGRGGEMRGGEESSS
jgi:hypothetical protein